MTKKKRLLIGNANFEYMIANNGYFVDKTLFLKEFLYSDDHVVLLPRPRRFGKTMNLSMTKYFFDVNKKEHAGLFSEFKISGDKAFCEAHQSKYPVIHVSLKSARGNNWEEAFLYLKDLIAELYNEHNYLLQSDKISDFEKENIKQVLQQKAGLNNFGLSLKKLSKYLYAHFGKKAIIIVDEYDTPIINGYKEDYYREIILFMQVFLGSAFKENNYLQKGLITGILRVARESIFSEMNNIGVFTITNNKFSDQFGFTENETLDILNHFGLSNQFENVKQWYDGYKFGITDQLYNPWSITKYISNHSEGFRPYWVNTGTDALIKDRILVPDVDQTYTTLQHLIAGEVIEKKLDENFIFQDLDSNRELLWTLLTYSGYLTPMERVYEDYFKVRIPNFEIRKVFKDIVLSWLTNSLKTTRDLVYKTAKHLVNNRLPEFEKGFRKIMGDTFSYFDINGIPENVYQSYVLGLLAVIGDDYIIRSNRESGEGRYDIMLLPHDRSKNGVVIEIKQIEKIEGEKENNLLKRVQQKRKEALKQIESKKYYKELVVHKIGKIIKIPIIFVGKEPYVI